MTRRARFIEEHGIVLQSAQHARIPSLAEFIAGEKIRGSWWGHEKGREIFRALVAVYESREVVATKLVDGKLTLIASPLVAGAGDAHATKGAFRARAWPR